MMEVLVVPMFSDNYAYLLVDREEKVCALVDPAEADKALQAAEKEGLRVVAVLTTHGHWDHASGNESVAAALGAGLEVVGGVADKVPACTRPVKNGDEVQVGRLQVRVLDVPCHTPGHVAFYVEPSALGSPGAATHPAAGAVFTGDTLFVGGSGNLNSGTPEMMHHALVEVLGALPDSTRVFCGHNYAEKNLLWALEVEPDNAHAQAKLEQVRALNAEQAFIPSTIGEEKLYNPFMRCVETRVQEWAKAPGDAVGTLLKIRQGKDAWGARSSV